MRYRDHAGSLSESMKTQVVLNSERELLDHINKFWGQFGWSVNLIKFDYVGVDARIDQDVYYVSVKFNFNTSTKDPIHDRFVIVGMIDGSGWDELKVKDL